MPEQHGSDIAIIFSILQFERRDVEAAAVKEAGARKHFVKKQIQAVFTRDGKRGQKEKKAAGRQEAGHILIDESAFGGEK